MANIEQLKSALINADKAGDAEAATALANEIKRMQATPEAAVEKYQELPWGDVAGQALSNLPSSAMQMGEDLATAVMNPIDTGAAAVEVGFGALSKMYPDWYIDFLDDYMLPDDTLKTAMAKADLVGQAMVDRYGSMEGFKRTLAKDPAGVMADAAGVLTAGGGAAIKAGAQIPRLAKAGNVAQKAAGYIDPLSLAAKTVGKTGSVLAQLPAATTGALSGLGQDVVSQLYQAGKKGGKEKATALQHMREPDVFAPDILTMAREGMENLRRDRSESYKSGMIDISSDATVLNFDNILDRYSKVVAENRTRQGHVKNPSKEAALVDIGDVLQKWQERGPDSWTADDFNSMKEEIGDLVDWNQKGQKTNIAYGEMYDTVKGEITKQAPVYAEIMSDYSDASKQIKELEKTLSLKDTAGADTAFRKLTSALRNNVNTNFGQRAELVGQLEDASGLPLKTAIAGQAANTLMPRGLQGLGMTGNLGAVAYGGLNPMQIPLLVAQSPRAVGETAVALGNITGKLPKLPKNVRIPSQVKNVVTSLPIRAGAIQAGRLPQLDEELRRRKILGE